MQMVYIALPKPKSLLSSILFTFFMKEQADLVHHFMQSLILPFKRHKTVVTVHDIIPLA